MEEKKITPQGALEDESLDQVAGGADFVRVQQIHVKCQSCEETWWTTERPFYVCSKCGSDKVVEID